MIKNIQALRDELTNYANPDMKVKSMVSKEEIFPLKKGIYETNKETPGHYLAAAIYGPSYISFEYALFFHELCTKGKSIFTSATFGKRRKKEYENYFGTYTYRDVPMSVYYFENLLKIEDGYTYLIASPEKTICDMIYVANPKNNQTELENYLFDELKISKKKFKNLNFEKMIKLSELYKTKNHNFFINFLSNDKKNNKKT